MTQGDTEPASVEQQRHLGRTCPSLYDLRNLFQVNVEEGRHLWAMVYLLDALLRPRRPRGVGGAAAAALGRRRQAPHPRRVQRADAGLAVVLHVLLLHRPRRQVPAREPGGERLRPALAHLPLHADRGSAPHVRGRGGHRAHRAAHVRADARAQDRRRAAPRRHRPRRRSRSTSTSTARSRSISSARRVSTNAANFYTMGLKGRFEETKKADDHRLKDATYSVAELVGDSIDMREEAALVVPERAAARRLRRRLPARGDALEPGHQEPRHRRRAARCPTAAFTAAIGVFADAKVSPDGRVISEAEWDARHARLAAHRGRPGLHRQLDAVRHRARPVCQRGSRRPRGASTDRPSTSNTCGSTEPAGEGDDGDPGPVQRGKLLRRSARGRGARRQGGLLL